MSKWNKWLIRLVSKMNKYHITIYFSSTMNLETNVESELDIKDFTNEMSEKFNSKDNIFLNFIGDDIKYSVNRNNVLFYTIKLKWSLKEEKKGTKI